MQSILFSKPIPLAEWIDRGIDLLFQAEQLRMAETDEDCRHLERMLTRFEAQIEGDFDPVLSRKIDCIHFLLSE